MNPFVAPEFTELMDRVSGARAPADVVAAVSMMRSMKSPAPDPRAVVPPGVEVTRQSVRARGRSVDVLVAAPERRRELSVLLAFHSGGMISGQAEHGLAEAAALLRDDRAVVVVEYGIAPEVSYARAVEDGLTAVSWIHDAGRRRGWDPRSLVVTGTSGGGAIAFSTVAQACDAGRTVAGLLLASPMLDDASASASMIETEGEGTWDRGWNRVAWAAALHDDADRALVPSRLPAEGLPPTYLDVGSADALRSEVVARAEALWSAGVAAELHVWPGGFHGFDVAVPDAPVSRAARAARDSWLNRLSVGSLTR